MQPMQITGQNGYGILLPDGTGLPDSPQFDVPLAETTRREQWIS
jgi:hypothetical protein